MSRFDEIVEGYKPKTDEDLCNAQREVMQKVALAGLRRGGFFKYAAFYGDTCLRIFHGLRRYSEDMDFSLIEKNSDIHIEDFFQPVVEEFDSVGMPVMITKKEKKKFGGVESAFLKENTETYDLKFQTHKTLKVKLELDTDPPLRFSTEQRLIVEPYSFSVNCFVLPDLFAGKMHALVYRSWQRRVKGRDWYDFEWYVKKRIPLNFSHLSERIREFNNADVSKEQFMQTLKERLMKADIELVKQDVLPYVEDSRDLEIWSNKYFVQLADLMVVE